MLLSVRLCVVGVGIQTITSDEGTIKPLGYERGL